MLSDPIAGLHEPHKERSAMELEQVPPGGDLVQPVDWCHGGPTAILCAFWRVGHVWFFFAYKERKRSPPVRFSLIPAAGSVKLHNHTTPHGARSPTNGNGQHQNHTIITPSPLGALLAYRGVRSSGWSVLLCFSSKIVAHSRYRRRRRWRSKEAAQLLEPLGSHAKRRAAAAAAATVMADKW